MTIPTAPPALKATGLRKSFGQKTVLDGIDLDIAEGTTFSLLGPNGAGKTTTVQILSTLLSADAGEVQVAGFDLAREPSHRSSTPCAACSPARRSDTARSLPPRGALASPPSATCGHAGDTTTTRAGFEAPRVSGGRGPGGAGPLRTLPLAGGGAGRPHPSC
jgi:energy-coupling factor transporter ATP-binding protein EcfA2